MAEGGSREVRELRALPLEDLIVAPLNAAINAQAAAALSTADFVKRVGFVDPKSKSLFDRPEDSDKSDVRIAELRVTKKNKKADGSVEEVTESIEIPFITLFNIPALEIGSLDWSFDVKLKSVEAFETDLTHSVSTTSTTGASVGLPLKALAIGVQMKVETAAKTDFNLRYGQGREGEYNLRVSIKANAAPIPRGIERLMDIAERIAIENQAVTASPGS